MSSTLAVAAVSLHLLGKVLYGIAFGAAFFESIAFVGLIIPSTSLLIAFGFLAYWDIAQGGLLFAAVVVGGFLGDVASFLFGRNGARWFKPGNKIFKLSYLQKGELFFARHGAKSVVFARFISPLRPIIPFVAGLLNMNVFRFIAYAGAGGLLSTAAYFAAGYALGTISSRSMPYISRLEEVCLAVLALTAVGVFFRRFLIRKGERLFVAVRIFTTAFWARLIQFPRFAALLNRHRRLANWLAARPHRSGVLIMLLGCVIVLPLGCAIPFFGTWLDSAAVQSLDIPVITALFIKRSAALTAIARMITVLGSPYGIFLIATGWTAYLAFHRRFRTAGVFAGTVISASLMTVLIKHLVARPRPDASIASYTETLFSFPSYHATLILVAAFFSAYFIAALCRTWRARVNVWFGALLLTLLVGMTRVYLGVHYPTDVAFGYMFGFGVFLIGLGLDKALRKPCLDKPPENR